MAKIMTYQETDLNRTLAYDAHRGLSHTPEVRADQEVAGYMGEMEAVCDTFGAFATPENEAQLKADLERYRLGYLKHLNARLGAMSRVYSASISGPANFPARQMENRYATLDRRMAELLEFRVKALARLRRDYDPAVIARRPISADEPDAIEQLQAEIDRAEKDQATMKAVNRIVISKKLDDQAKVEKIKALNVSDELLNYMRRAGEGKFPSYRLANNNANIKRMKARIATLQAEAARPEAPDHQAAIDGIPVTIIENRDENRLQLVFKGKPPPEIRTLLKRQAFKWSRSQEAWQRKLTANARHAVDTIISDN